MQHPNAHHQDANQESPRTTLSGRRLSAAGALVAAVVLSALHCAPAARAEGSGGSGGPKGVRSNWPCPGCTTYVPSSYNPSKPAPLVVALHGDEGTAQYAFQAWRYPAGAAGYILVALQCPASEGCQGSWWQWAGDPAWLHEQVDALEASYNIERSREFITGWSGGANYIAAVSEALSPRFAAMSLVAGGYAPDLDACPSCKTPVHMMIGDQDSLLPYATATRDFFEGCGHEVTWDLLPGLNHWTGIQALGSQGKAAAILSWFSARPNQCQAEED